MSSIIYKKYRILYLISTTTTNRDKNILNGI